ncbi:MAG: sugar ABC transporter substrate-binding protein [Christensenellaceae bacterium]
MTKKIISIVLVVVMCVFALVSCAEPADKVQATPDAAAATKAPAVADASATEAPAADAPKDTKFTVGYLGWGLTDEWNQYGFEAFKWAAEQKGVEVIGLDPQKDPQKQVAQAEELISKGVDAITIFPCTPESAATVVRMCNEAGIPIAVENIFLPEDASAGEVIGQVACQYGDIGYAAIKYAAEKWPGCKLLYVHGGPGIGVYEDYKTGVDRAMEEFKGKVDMVGLINGEWETEPSYNVTMEFITSGKSDFDVVFANNGMIAMGVYQALKENGMDNIPIISTGGAPTEFKMMEEGKEYANMTAPVNIQGEILFRYVWQYLNGVAIEETKIPLPVIPIDVDNFDERIEWGDFEAASDYIGGITP